MIVCNIMCIAIIMYLNLPHFIQAYKTWTDSVIQEVANLKSNQLLIINNQLNSSSINEDMLKLVQNVPTICLNINKYIPTISNDSLVYSGSIEKKGKPFHLIFCDSDISKEEDIDQNSLKRFFNHYPKLVSNQMRPKCLIVIYSKTHLSKSFTQFLLYYGWTKKFLDLTLLNVIGSRKESNIDIVVNHYNPFFNTYSNESWNTQTILFPVKLTNMNRYPIKIPIYHIPPYMQIDKYNNGTIREISGINYQFTPIIAEFLNFSIVIVKTLDVTKFGLFMKDLKALIENEEVNMLPIPMYYSPNRNLINLDQSYPVIFAYFAVLVPILPHSSINVSASLLLNPIISFIVLIVLLSLLTHLLKFQKNLWKVEDILRILLGCSVPKHPRTLKERIVLFSLILVSITDVNEFFSKLMNLKVVTTYAPFHTLEEIDDSGLNIFIEPWGINTLFTPDDEIGQRLKSKAVNLLSNAECVVRLQKFGNYACFLEKSEAKMFMDMYRKYKPFMKMSKLELPFDWMAYPYERGSPYIERFDQIFFRIMESGIEKHWTLKHDFYDVEESKSTGKDKGKNILAMQLGIILIIGQIVSLVVFCGEILLFRYL